MSTVNCSIFLKEENTWNDPVISSVVFAWKSKLLSLTGEFLPTTLIQVLTEINSKFMLKGGE